MYDQPFLPILRDGHLSFPTEMDAWIFSISREPTASLASFSARRTSTVRTVKSSAPFGDDSRWSWRLDLLKALGDAFFRGLWTDGGGGTPPAGDLSAWDFGAQDMFNPREVAGSRETEYCYYSTR